MIEIIVISGLIVGLVGLGIIYVVQNLIKPHKLDTIKSMLESGKYQDAINALNAILKNDESNPLAHLYLAEAYYLSGSYDLALVEYKQVIFTGKFSNSATERVIRRRLAEIYMKFNQLEEAQKEYIILSKIEPHNAEYLYQIGNIFYLRGMREQAISYLDKAMKSGKNSADVYFLMGKIYYEVSRPNEALAILTNCVKLDPKHSEAHYYIGLILKSMNSYGKSIQEFDITEQTKDLSLKIKAIYQKGLCKMEIGDLEGAKADFERGLKYSSEENNTTIAIRYALGLAYEKERRLVEAVEQWEKVAQLRPNFQDVQLKLAQYEDLRVDDKLKDILTSTPTTFEIITQNLLRNIGYEPLESTMIDDDNIEIVGMEKSTKWRNVRGGKVLVRVSRDNEDVGEDQIATLVEKLKSVHGIRAVYITTGKFTPQALRYSENRPVDLYDRQKLTGIFKQLPKS
ncbi:MAG: tetratricopeptide repeat protein [Brevinematia bacterium]